MVTEMTISEKMNMDELIEDVIEREGGYVDHPADRGGADQLGHDRRRSRGGRAMPATCARCRKSDAAAIYKRLYWLAPRFDAVAERAPKLAAELFDTGVNMGTGTASGFLQRALNALNRKAADYPDIGRPADWPATLAALDAFLNKRGRAAKRFC